MLQGRFRHALAWTLLAPLPALAQADSPACRIECAAPFAERAQNTVTIQSCLARCTARSAALGAANVTAATIMPLPQSPWTTAPGARRAAPQPVAAPQAAGTGARGARRGAAPAPPARRPAGNR